jgi:hypothetical protein
MPNDHPTTAITIRPELNNSTQPISEITKERSVLQAVRFTFSQAKVVAKTRNEVTGRAGVYFLWAEPWNGTGDADEEGADTGTGISTMREIYIGSSDDLSERLKTWASDDWWQHGMAFSTANREIDGEQARYVEERLIKRAAIYSKCDLRNKIFHTKEPPENDESAKLDANVGRKDEADYFFREILVTLPLVGVDALVSSEEDEAITASPTGHPDHFFLKFAQGDVEAEGAMRDDGFLVFKGARARKVPAPGFTDQYAASVYRQKLIQDGVLQPSDQNFILTKDKLFPSPSSAASVLAGSNKSGPREWKNADGKSLKQIILSS